jgi:hypothetical protein
MPSPLVLIVASASVIVVAAWPNAAAALRDELPVTNIQILTRPGLPAHQPLGDASITATCAGATADNGSEKDNSRICQRSWSDR